MIKYTLSQKYIFSCLSKLCYVSDFKNSSGTGLLQRNNLFTHIKLDFNNAATATGKP